jgi:hypothetical protein
MRAINRRIIAGTVEEFPSKGGSVAYAYTNRGEVRP